MDMDQISIVVGIIVVVLILRAISTRKVGRPSSFHQSSKSRKIPKRSKINGPVDEDVQQLIRDKKKIQAIKLVREKHGVGLKEAKEYVERLQKHQPTNMPKKATMRDIPAVRDEALRLVREGKKIEAIKLMQDATGIGLKEAKSLVEKLEKMV